MATDAERGQQTPPACPPRGSTGTGTREPALQRLDGRHGALFAGVGPFAALCLAIGSSLLIIAIGVDGARDGKSWGEALYWGGLLVLILPCVLRLAGSSASRRERLALLVLIGLALLAVDYFVDPLGFNNHDEFGHLRETLDIISSRHLFPRNPIQAEYTYFPGIELATSTFAHFSGLSIISSWRLLAVALRTVELLAIFLLIERATGSSRVASLGTLIYMTNPSFTYFDAHFSYESFALPLGFLLVQQAATIDARAPPLASWILFTIVLVALTVSHHLASYIVVAILVLLAAAARFDRRAPKARWRARAQAQLAVAAAVVVGAWTALIAPATVSNYLGPVLREAVSSTVSFVAGSRAAEKTLFEAQNKQASPPLEQLVGFAAVLLLILMLGWGLWRLWRRGRLASPLPVVLALVAIAYPATLLFRLTLNGSETSDRASAYVYLGLGYVVGAGVFALASSGDRTPVRPAHGLSFPAVGLVRRPAIRVLGISLAVGLLSFGGIVIGTSRSERLPGSYDPALTARAASDPESLAAARWAGRVLEPRQRLFSDIVDRLLMSSYGRENTVCCYLHNQLLPELFLTPTFSARDTRLIRLNQIRLVVVDRRLDKPSPSTHLFFERADGGPYYHPLSDRALNKFAGVPGIDELFDSGNIAIYDTAALTH